MSRSVFSLFVFGVYCVALGTALTLRSTAQRPPVTAQKVASSR